MALTDEQRGPRAAWLRLHRTKDYGSGDGGLEKLSTALRLRGIERSPTTIKGWEASDERSPIPEDILPVLEELFGEKAPPRAPTALAGDIVAALREQTRAINDLVGKLDILGDAVSAMLAERVREEASPRSASGARSR